jgi:hypothetical protein
MSLPQITLNIEKLKIYMHWQNFMDILDIFILVPYSGSQI